MEEKWTSPTSLPFHIFFPRAVCIRKDISIHLTIISWAFTLDQSDPMLRPGDPGTIRTHSLCSGNSSLLWKTNLGTNKLKWAFYGKIVDIQGLQEGGINFVSSGTWWVIRARFFQKREDEWGLIKGREYPPGQVFWQRGQHVKSVQGWSRQSAWATRNASVGAQRTRTEGVRIMLRT